MRHKISSSSDELQLNWLTFFIFFFFRLLLDVCASRGVLSEVFNQPLFSLSLFFLCCCSWVLMLKKSSTIRVYWWCYKNKNSSWIFFYSITVAHWKMQRTKINSLMIFSLYLFRLPARHPRKSDFFSLFICYLNWIKFFVVRFSKESQKLHRCPRRRRRCW